jgi:aryl-alcohol dehydrogenase-like predicted oxidoreductase
MSARDKLPVTRLGKSGPLVGTQGLGCMGMSEFYGPADPRDCLKTLDRALELGVNLFDTADSYGTGRNEELIGPFVRANRDQVVIATKVGLVRRADDPHYRGIDNSAAYIRSAAEASLRRLGVDSIDLYYLHRRDPGTPLEESVGAMAELIGQGKVRYLGLSEVTGEELHAAQAVHEITALQSEWSLFSRDAEATSVPVAASLGVAVVPYSPLGRGFLAGSFADGSQLSEGDFRRHMARFTGENARHNARLLGLVRKIATARHATPAQIALAWVHHRASVHGTTVVPIPGTRSRTRLEENVAAATLELNGEELAELGSIAAEVAGSRDAGLTFASATRNP